MESFGWVILLVFLYFFRDDEEKQNANEHKKIATAVAEELRKEIF